MRKRWFVLPVALAFLICLPTSAEAQERSGGKALERIRAAVQKMKEQGRSDTEILKVVRDMADRALAQQGGRGEARRGPATPGPNTPRARAMRSGPPGQPGMSRRSPSRAGPPSARRGAPPLEDRQQVMKKAQEQARTLGQRMHAQGKSPEEIRAAMQKIRERTQAAMRRMGPPPEARGGPTPGRRMMAPQGRRPDEARRGPDAPGAPARRPGPSVRTPEGPKGAPAGDRQLLLERARKHAAELGRKMHAEGKSPEEIRAAMQRIRERVQNAMREMGPPPEARGGPTPGRRMMAPQGRRPDEARRGPDAPGAPARRPGPSVRTPERPKAPPAGDRQQLLERAREHSAALERKMRAEGKSPEEIRAAMQQIRDRVQNAMREMGPPPEARRGPPPSRSPDSSFDY